MISQRNRIEHSLADVPDEALRDSIADAVNLISRFCREQMEVEAVWLFGPATCRMVLQRKTCRSDSPAPPAEPLKGTRARRRGDPGRGGR